jgi:hypothetical protein
VIGPDVSKPVDTIESLLREAKEIRKSHRYGSCVPAWPAITAGRSVNAGRANYSNSVCVRWGGSRIAKGTTCHRGDEHHSQIRSHEF